MLPLQLWLAHYIAESWYIVDQELLRTIGTFVGPALAALVVMIGWRRTHTDASNRDLENWRRTTLLTALTDTAHLVDELLVEVEYPLTESSTHNYYRNRSLEALSQIDRNAKIMTICRAKELADLTERIWDSMHLADTKIKTFYALYDHVESNEVIDKNMKRLEESFTNILPDILITKDSLMKSAGPFYKQ